MLLKITRSANNFTLQEILKPTAKLQQINPVNTVIDNQEKVKFKQRSTQQIKTKTWQTQTRKKKRGYKEFLPVIDIAPDLKQKITFRNGQSDNTKTVIQAPQQLPR